MREMVVTAEMVEMGAMKEEMVGMVVTQVTNTV